MRFATSGAEVSAGANDRPGTPYTHETTNGDASITDPTVDQSSDEHSDILSYPNTELKKCGVNQEQKEETSIRMELQERNLECRLAPSVTNTKMMALSDRSLVQSKDVKQ